MTVYLLLLLWMGASQALSIRTRDSLTLHQGTYSSLLFLAEPARNPRTQLPEQYRFAESGQIPEGMKFESYPCNRPDQKTCSQLASANGIYLDGTPRTIGAYKFTIVVENVGGEKTASTFEVTVTADHSASGR